MRELDVDIAVRRAELEVLERCRAIVARSADDDAGCDLHAASACSGQVWIRWCRACRAGWVVRRCDAHGGLGAATTEANTHRADHGFEPAAASSHRSPVTSPRKKTRR